MVDKIHIRRWFNTYVTTLEIPMELKDAMRTHPRIQIFLDNLYKKLQEVQVTRTLKGKPPFSENTIKYAVHSLTDWFVITVKEEGERRYRSKLEEMRLKKIAETQADLEKTSNGKPTGDFEELGLLFPEDREEKENGYAETES